VIHWLNSPDDPLPDTRQALPPGSEAPGLLAAGGELSSARLAEAYRKGVFPWYSEGQPVLWWSPDPRMVLKVDDFKLSNSLRKTVRRFARSHDCEVRIDSDFRAVITACAGTPRLGQDSTWIVPEMVEAYCRWHAQGAAHSVETWIGGRLVGGLYGIGIGRMFFGESMFSHRTDASKIAVCALMAFCRSHGVTLVDCQQRTEHLHSLGAREISRREFEEALPPRLGASAITDWTYDPAMWDLLEQPPHAPPAQDTGP
jgi:leucyl/phenylalanyl-tRNA--protein transferase